jgi:hypothetical protein
MVAVLSRPAEVRVAPGRGGAAAGEGDLDDGGAAMKIRFLPRWPPRWTSASGGSHPGERAGVLQPVKWRVDLQGERNLRLTMEYGGHLWSGLYPDDARRQAELGEERLQRLHRMLTAHVGQETRESSNSTSEGTRATLEATERVL